VAKYKAFQVQVQLQLNMNASAKAISASLMKRNVCEWKGSAFEIHYSETTLYQVCCFPSMLLSSFSEILSLHTLKKNEIVLISIS
jgi:hypothetical protein